MDSENGKKSNKKKMGIMILQISVPGPEITSKALKIPPKPEPEEEVRRITDDMKAGGCSSQDWILLCKLYNALKAERKQTPRIQNLIKMMEPELAKHGYYGQADRRYE